MGLETTSGYAVLHSLRHLRWLPSRSLSVAISITMKLWRQTAIRQARGAERLVRVQKLGRQIRSGENNLDSVTLIRLVAGILAVVVFDWSSG